MNKTGQLNQDTKFIIVTGGVLSGLGKGIAAACIGALINSKLNVIPIKCDGYLNTDPGTMNPIEHGEVFVLDDGGEVDMDFGHYERFLNINTKFEWNLTMGKIFKNILEKERRGDFLGKTVQFIPHVTDEIKNLFYNIANKEKAEVLIIEIGGTIGDLENMFYIEAARQLIHDVGYQNHLSVHLTYIPIPSGVNEQKSKPTQQSVKMLNQSGIFPDIIIGRCSEWIDDKVKNKIALFCNISKEAVLSGIDVKNVYEIPIIFEQQNLAELLHKRLGIYSPPKLLQWSHLVDVLTINRENPEKEVSIAIAGKYTKLEDSYASVVEALVHCSAHLDVKVNIGWIETTRIEKGEVTIEEALKGINGIIVPGGFGLRGTEGKIQVIKYVRENDIPFLGICFGMQLAVVEFARNVCGLKYANSEELLEDDPEVRIDDPVVCILPEQKGITDKGATMRLGGRDVEIKKGSKAWEIHDKKPFVRKRFRHRYEVNPDYLKMLEKSGIVFSGWASGKRIMQIMELPDKLFFMAAQFHPELTSRFIKPDEMFLELVRSMVKKKYN
jgi:CTP synthase